MTLLALGINHKTAPVALRERVTFSPDTLDKALESLLAQPMVQGGVVLSTCNRTELYLSVEEQDNLQEALIRWLCDYHHLNEEDLRKSLYWHQDNDAVSHLMRVASGLDSLVLGEPQILGQIRDTNGIKEYGARNLDPRVRSSFYAIVHHNDLPDERISSTGGKSGGALQELTSFVYGAALIYLLGGDLTGKPTYTTLFLDEALIKADGRYTKRALTVLPRLGFQIIVSAPESKTAEILSIADKAYVAYKDPATGNSYLQELDREPATQAETQDATVEQTQPATEA